MPPILSKIKRHLNKELVVSFSLILLIITSWLWVWGRCASPFAVECFTNNHSFPLDYSQAYLGFHAYMHANSLIPPTFDSLTWPRISSAALTDSMPLIAILSKVIARIFNIDSPFQFFSIANLTNNLLIFASVNYVRKKLRLSLTTYVALTVFLVFSPIALVRLQVHPFHANHFPIILPILLFALSINSIWIWSFALILSIGISLYYVLVPLTYYIVLQILSISRQCHSSVSFKSSLSNSLPKTVVSLIGLLCLALFSAWSFGFFVPADRSDPNYQIWDANLLSLVNPQGYFKSLDPISSLIPLIKTDLPYEWEGNGYLGVSILILAAICIISYLCTGLIVTSTDSFRRQPSIVPSSDPVLLVYSVLFFIPAIILFVFSLGPEIHIGEYHILSLRNYVPYLYDNKLSLYSYFRASGRFVWPLVYSTYIFLWVYLDKRIPFISSRKKFLSIALLSLFFVELVLPLLSSASRDISKRFYDGKLVLERVAELSLSYSDTLKQGDVLLTNASLERILPIEPYTLPLIDPPIRTNFKAHVGRYPPGFISDREMSLGQIKSSYCLENIITSKARVFVLSPDAHDAQAIPSLEQVDCLEVVD